ncbi:MAG TPA: glycosyltransferase [Candidatus Cloacimonetes bacterium]|nr:glycosyltransferase [Candidatus Cloacimonadota bacterium]
MKIYFAGYQTLMLNRGGPTYKIIHLKKKLEEIGVNVQLFNMWDKDLKIGKNDLVHIFNASISTFDLAMNLKPYGAKFVVNPIFFSNHSAKTLRIYQTLEKPFHKIFKRTYSDYSLTKDICNASKKVLPNTKAEADLLNLGLGVDKKKIKIIHNGVEERFLNSDPDLFIKKYGIKDFVLYVGHLGPVRKNGKNIIKALQEIDHPAIIIADILHNEEGNWCRKEIEKTKNILLIEWLKHDDPLLASAYATCKTFILPTRYETPGRAALEAGLAGANIVITPFGGTKEYFADMVDYVDPHSINSIKNGIQNSLNKNKSDHLKEHIKKNFIWKVIAEQTQQMYQEVLDINI